MGRRLACAAVATAVLFGSWRLAQDSGPARARVDAPAPRVVEAPSALPEAASAEPPASTLASPGLSGVATRQGVRWSAPDGRWSVSWGWAEIEGIHAAAADVVQDGDRQIVEHGSIQEVFERRANGVEHIITVRERPEAFEVRIRVDADTRSWDFDGQPRVTLSRPGEGDLLEVQGLTVYDAENRKLVASMTHEPGAILITVEDDGATYPVTIDPLITPPSWTADPTTSSWSAFGTAVAGAGDFNRDGFADVVVGAKGDRERVFVYFGSSQGLGATAGWTLMQPLASLSTTFGLRLAGAGDVNGDGYADIAVGDPQPGRVFLYLGGTSGPSSAAAWTGGSGGYFGQSLASAGDVNLDGRGDLLVGADGGGYSRGSAHVYYGTSTGLASTPAWSVTSMEYSTRFGASVASAGDVNGDGYLDVVVGAPEFSGQATREGRAYLFLGTSTGLSTTSAWTVDPTDTAESRFGTCVAGAGDINQDGFADILVGAPSGPDGGRVYLYLGSSSGPGAIPAWTADPPQTGARQYGAQVVCPGDLNGDGRRDVVVAAPYKYQGEAAEGGTIYVYLNSSGGLPPTPALILAPTGQSEVHFGSSLAAPGDTNGDGRPDLLVGCPDWSGATLSGNGRAYVYPGTSTRTAVPWLLSPAVEARLGTGTPTLDWDDVADPNGIQSYDVEVDDASTFAAPLLWSGTVTTSQATTGMLPEAAFYWRVRARDGLGNLSDWSLVRKAYADGVGPLTPQPFSPVGDAWSIATPRLSWTGSGDPSGVANYDVQVARASDFSGPLEFSATTQNFVDMAALGEGRHYWRVRARDTWGWTSAWAVTSFVVDAVAPTAPALLSPADGAVVTEGNPLLDWSDSTDANALGNYVVQVDNEPTFANPVTWAVSVTASQVEAASFSGTLFYWRVAASDRAGNGVWSGVRSFSRSGSLPGPVSVITPPYGTAFANPVVSLDWTDATDPDGISGYEAQVSTDAGFTTIAWSGSATESRATTTALPEGALYWHARAVDALGNRGLWSATATFQVDATAPTSPSPVSPADGFVFVTSNPFLDWTDATDNLPYPQYDVEIDTESSFALPVARSFVSGWSGANLSGFADGSYFWRVRTRDAAGNVSAWGVTRAFVVDSALPPAPTPVSPASSAVVMTATPTIDWSDVADPSGVTYEVVVDDENTFSPPTIASASGLGSSQWAASWLGDCGQRYWRVRAVDGVGHVGVWSATSGFTVDRGRGFYVGLGSGANGQIGACRDEAAGFGWRPMYWLADAAYNAASGETRPAAGDLDGDGASELVVGRGRFTSPGGYFAILDDTGAGFVVQRWIQIPFSSYNSVNGETWPACGDIDGDGRDEIVIGLGTYTSQGGYFALYDDASTGYAFIGWRRISWSQYNAANGETRPACGDVTGDGRAEVFVGLGRYPARGGRVARYTSGSVAFSAWMQFSYTAYNSANGETFPACGDVDADGRDELCVGMGAYPQGGGYVQYFNDSVARYASLGLKRLPWTAYNSAVGETRPSLGPVMGGVGDETVIGLGAWEPAAGWVAVMDRAPGYGLLAWKRVPAENLTTSAGATRPSVRR